jgi:hypothetical protein
LLINAAQRVPVQDYDVLLSLEFGLRETTLSAYTENLGQDSYRYQKQSLRDDHIGVAARLDERMDTAYGHLTLSGEFGYRADISSDSQASLYRLSDTTTIYTHQIERSQGAHSLSHTRLALAAALARDNGWHYRARTSWQDYKSGYLGRGELLGRLSLLIKWGREATACPVSVKTAYRQSSCGAASGHGRHSHPSRHAAMSDYPKSPACLSTIYANR